MVPRPLHGRPNPQPHLPKAYGLSRGWAVGPGLSALNTVLTVIDPSPPPPGGTPNIGFDWSDPDQSISVGL